MHTCFFLFFCHLYIYFLTSAQRPTPSHIVVVYMRGLLPFSDYLHPFSFLVPGYIKTHVHGYIYGSHYALGTIPYLSLHPPPPPPLPMPDSQGKGGGGESLCLNFYDGHLLNLAVKTGRGGRPHLDIQIFPCSLFSNDGQTGRNKS